MPGRTLNLFDFAVDEDPILAPADPVVIDDPPVVAEVDAADADPEASAAAEPFALFGRNLFGDEIMQDGGPLAQRFSWPPFTVFDARSGSWQDRKRAWLALGIQSELGRGGEAASATKDQEKLTEFQQTRKPNAAPGGSLMPAADYIIYGTPAPVAALSLAVAQSVSQRIAVSEAPGHPAPQSGIEAQK